MEIKYVTNDELVSQIKEKYLESAGSTKAVVEALKNADEVQEMDVMYIMSAYEHETLADEDDIKAINSIAHDLEQGHHMPPILVTGKLHVIFGNHNLLAAKKLNIHSVPILVLDLPE